MQTFVLHIKLQIKHFDVKKTHPKELPACRHVSNRQKGDPRIRCSSSKLSVPLAIYSGIREKAILEDYLGSEGRSDDVDSMSVLLS